MKNCVDITNDIYPVLVALQKQYKQIAHINLSKIRVVTAVYKKRNPVHAYLHTMNGPIRLFMFDDICYIVEICLPTSLKFTEQQICALLLHELLHIPEGGTNPTCKNYLQVEEEHESEDFYLVYKATGVTNWTQKNIMIRKVVDIDKKFGFNSDGGFSYG